MDLIRIPLYNLNTLSDNCLKSNIDGHQSIVGKELNCAYRIINSTCENILTLGFI